jgi:hypothetical protein
MKNKIQLSAFLALFSIFSFSAIAKFDVHVLYFKPTDAKEIDREYHDKMLKDIQKYLQSEMTRHGFEDKTFPLELGADRKIVIHTIAAKHGTAYYDIDDHAVMFKDKIEPELPLRFNNERNLDSRDNVHLILVGGIELNGVWGRGPAFGFTWHGGRWGGNAIVALDNINDFPDHYLGTVAHELGHAFGLDPGHNNVPASYNGTIVAWGKTTAEWSDRMRLLKHEASLLDSRPIFRKMDLQKEPPQLSTIDADVNSDGYIDLYDVIIVRSGMQNSVSYDTDINNDGVTDEVDLLIVKAKAVEAIAAAAPRKRKVNITTWGSLKMR